MSNMYITEPNTEGKVLLHTSFGDLDVELWPQQAPKACRNFVQLCLEGYYDNTIFHRLIAGFMLQGGDPTGTGSGGESIYGEPFVDEFHSRLRFNHRGLLAMANENKQNTNHSQFFFTLDACEFLNKKHTIFGKITGNTIFNLLSVAELETDGRDRPLNPPKLVSTEVLWNPFDNIVPREIKRKSASSNEAEDAAKKKKRDRKATKDLKLLSFGDEEEFQHEIGSKSKKAKKIMSSHDLLDDRKLKADVDEQLLQKIAEQHKETQNGNLSEISGDRDKKEAARASLKAAVSKAASKKQAPTSDSPRDPTEKKEAKLSDEGTDIQEQIKKKKKEKMRQIAKDQDEYAQLRNELRMNRKAVPLLMGAKAKEQEQQKAFADMLTPLQQQRQKYLQRKKAANRSAREKDTLLKLQKFTAALEDMNKQHESSKKEDTGNIESYHGQVLETDDSDTDGKDMSWMAAKLKFKKHIDDQFRAGFDPSTDDYMTVDTRDERKTRERQREGRSHHPHRSERRR